MIFGGYSKGKEDLPLHLSDFDCPLQPRAAWLA